MGEVRDIDESTSNKMRIDKRKVHEVDDRKVFFDQLFFCRLVPSRLPFGVQAS
jgi:hypothetical protein